MSEREEGILENLRMYAESAHHGEGDIVFLREVVWLVDTLNQRVRELEATHAKAMQSVLDGLTQMTEMRDREQHRATTAERERDEARRERDEMKQQVRWANDVAAGYEHRAERAERVVEAARAWDTATDLFDDTTNHQRACRNLHEAIRALDATTTLT